MIIKNIELEKLEKIFNLYKQNYKPIITDYTKIYAYVLDDIVVAFLIFNVMYEKCEIIDIFVIEEYRRKQIAQNLINEITRDYDIENITLEVSQNNINAINLYNKLGFKNVATRKNYYNDGDGFLMLKEIR